MPEAEPCHRHQSTERIALHEGLAGHPKADGGDADSRRGDGGNVQRVDGCRPVLAWRAKCGANDRGPMGSPPALFGAATEAWITLTIPLGSGVGRLLSGETSCDKLHATV